MRIFDRSRSDSAFLCFVNDIAEHNYADQSMKPILSRVART